MKRKRLVKWDGDVQKLIDFWARVVFLDDGCWEWDNPDVNGYGSFRGCPAHRFAYSITRRLQRKKVVRHTCDNRACVRPSHLLQGTRAQNSHDMAVRGCARSQVAPPSTPLIIYAPDGTCIEFSR